MAHPLSITIQQLSERVAGYAATCTDMNVESHDLNFGSDRSLMLTDQKTPSVPLGRLNDWALSQIEERLDAPGQRWLNDQNHCPDELRSMILDNLLAVRENLPLFMRFNGEGVRAVLSDQYTPFDNVQLVDMAAAALQTMKYEPEVHRTETGDNLRAYILLPQITFGDDKPDQYGSGGLHPAVYLRNSEIGNGKVRITSAVYRYVCGNGIIWGWDQEQSFELTHRFVAKASMNVLVMDAMASALKMSEEAANLFVKSQNVRVSEKALDKIVDAWGEKYGLTVEAKDNWLATITGEATSYGRTKDPRVADVINAATYVAQNRNADERETMERMAGSFLRTMIPHLNNSER